MKYGHLIVAIGAIGLAGASGLKAQATTQTTTTTTPASVSASSNNVNAPASAVSFSPSLTVGARTFSSGGIGNGQNSTTFGPFARPEAALKYSNSNVKVGLSYEFEATGGKGFGASNDQISDTAYFKHEPILTVSGGLTPALKLNGVIDAAFWLYNKAQKDNLSDIVVASDIEYALTPTVSASIGYLMQRKTNFDASLSSEKNAGKFAAVDTSSIGQEPLSTLHVGVLTTKIKLGEGNKLTTLIRAGKKLGNTAGSEAYSYRFQTHLDFTGPIPALSGALRYRVNVEDVKGANINYYQLGRVELNYALSTNWKAVLANEFVALQSTTAGKKAAYENENYVGASYSF